MLPDYPHNTQAWYLTEEDKALALKRNANAGKAKITGKLDWALAKRMFGNWRLYVLVGMYIFVSLFLVSFVFGIRVIPWRKNLTLTSPAVWQLVSSQQLLWNLFEIGKIFSHSAECHSGLRQYR